MEAEMLPAAARASKQSENFRDLMTLIRSRTDATAKGLAAVGTAAVSAIGYAKLVEVFPYHGPSWAPFVLVAGFLAMFAAVLALVWRFERTANTVITFSDIELTQTRSELSAAESDTLEQEYGDTAKLNGVGSLRAYNARAHRFERIADRTGDPGTARELRARADVIRAEVLATQDRAVVFILRKRAKEAFFSLWVALFLFLFLVGWYGAGLAANALQAQRDQAAQERPASEPSAEMVPGARQGVGGSS